MKSIFQLSEQHRAVLMSNPWFAGLPEELREDIMARGQLRTLMPDECLCRRGEDPKGWYAVLEGAIRLSSVSCEGQESVMHFYDPGSWLGDLAMIDGLPRAYDSYAHLPSVLLQIRLADFVELQQRHPVFRQQLLELQCRRVRYLLSIYEAASTQALEKRLASRLLILALGFGSNTSDGVVSIALHLPQETLAQLLGASRQRINQVLKQWEADGMIEQKYGRITLLDKPRLERLAEECERPLREFGYDVPFGSARQFI
ncbi:Crp/Fnr family transcriptional regulator [Pseudomonas schmalbachii]|uniref:Crp/Fnr family transcriptional regulator n=1 Tax=Pseudomonas schmalbachii TaxID=2816993 RepID=A0ABS3TPR3_9PSED|nr:Crp/Fnr family transcriptional regulator [Pseudomonas schmalbachii]MBO3275158.1 Crp/Fnr family transcriptional regulator [Pseudomonas schmalbachii]